MHNNMFKWFFAFLAMFLILIAAIWLTPAVPGATGSLHPTFKTMLKSGDYAGGGVAIKWLSYLFGLGIIGIFGFCIFTGLKKKDGAIPRNMRLILFFGFTAYVIIYSLMVFSYWEFQQNDNPAFTGGFPVPTAWMLYGMWFVPAVITVTYIVKFDDWILTKEEEDRFHEIVAARRKREAAVSDEHFTTD